MEKEKLYQLKSEANQINPILNIGKNGVTDTLIEELNKQIKANRLVKVRVLKSAEEGKDCKGYRRRNCKRYKIHTDRGTWKDRGSIQVKNSERRNYLFLCFGFWAAFSNKKPAFYFNTNNFLSFKMKNKVFL